MKAKVLLLSLLIISLIVSTVLFERSFTPIPAPNITFTTINGKKIELIKLQGKPVIVTFWATDCASCIEEIPHLIKLYDQFHLRGLEIIAVAMYYDPPSHVVNMTRAKQLPYKVALDLKAEHALAFNRVQLTPSTFLISPTGSIVMHTIGKINFSEMQQQLTTLIQG